MRGLGEARVINVFEQLKDAVPNGDYGIKIKGADITLLLDNRFYDEGFIVVTSIRARQNQSWAYLSH